jgi:hypothetical protein
MDPNPFKHPAIMLAAVRTAIEPALLAAGFRFEGRNDPRPGPPLYLFLDYSRGNETFRVAWDRRDSNRFIGFTAELLTESGAYTIVTSTELHGLAVIRKHSITSAIQLHLDAFTKKIKDFLAERLCAPKPVSPT